MLHPCFFSCNWVLWLTDCNFSALKHSYPQPTDLIHNPCVNIIKHHSSLILFRRAIGRSPSPSKTFSVEGRTRTTTWTNVVNRKTTLKLPGSDFASSPRRNSGKNNFETTTAQLDHNNVRLSSGRRGDTWPDTSSQPEQRPRPSRRQSICAAPTTVARHREFAPASRYHTSICNQSTTASFEPSKNVGHKHTHKA